MQAWDRVPGEDDAARARYRRHAGDGRIDGSPSPRDYFRRSPERTRRFEGDFDDDDGGGDEHREYMSRRRVLAARKEHSSPDPHSWNDHFSPPRSDRCAEDEFGVDYGSQRQHERMGRLRDYTGRLVAQQRAVIGRVGLLRRMFAAEYIADYWQLRLSRSAGLAGRDEAAKAVLGAITTVQGAVSERFPCHPFKTVYLPLKYGSNPGVNGVSYRGGHWRHLG
jgi:hypothetical protein